MKSSVAKTITVMALVLAVGTAPALAKGNTGTNKKSNSFPQIQQNKFPSFNSQTKSTNKAATPKSTNGSKNNFAFGNAKSTWSPMPAYTGIFFSNPDAMGTVSSVSEKDSTVTIKDADGKEITVHINPLTKISKLPSTEKKEEAKSAEAKSAEESKDAKDDVKAKEKTSAARVKRTAPSISDITTGDWVAVKKIKTDTKVLEASQLLIKQ